MSSSEPKTKEFKQLKKLNILQDIFYYNQKTKQLRYVDMRKYNYSMGTTVVCIVNNKHKVKSFDDLLRVTDGYDYYMDYDGCNVDEDCQCIGKNFMITISSCNPELQYDQP
jgi:hypothetical protein